MKVLLVSNQKQNSDGIGNPVIYRMRDSLERTGALDLVSFFPVSNSMKFLKQLRFLAKDFDIVHVHFGGMYALIIWFALVGVSNHKIITFHGTDIHGRGIKTANSRGEKIRIRLNQW